LLPRESESPIYSRFSKPSWDENPPYKGFGLPPRLGDCAAYSVCSLCKLPSAYQPTPYLLSIPSNYYAASLSFASFASWALSLSLGKIPIMVSWYPAPPAISRRVLLAAARQQPAQRSGISASTRFFFPHQAGWAQLGGRRALFSTTTTAKQKSSKRWASAFVISGSALGALFLYHQTPARMDSLQSKAATERQSEPAELPVRPSTSPLCMQSHASRDRAAHHVCLGVCVSWPQRTGRKGGLPTTVLRNS
jgi:hypothetical protein